MNKKKYKTNLNLRPPKGREGDIERLEYLAKLDTRSTNSYVWKVLQRHIDARNTTILKQDAI